MTLLVVMSPCALVLSIPSAILAAIAWGARHGILFRGGAAIEKLAEVDVVCMDKTGTLTEGELRVTAVESFPPGRDAEVARIAITLEAHSNHPIARAIVAHGKAQGLAPGELADFQSLTGAGLRGTVDGQVTYVGRRELMAAGRVRRMGGPDSRRAPRLHRGLGAAGATSSAASSCRTPSARAAGGCSSKLKADGVHTIMLTGDRRAAAEQVGKDLGLSAVCAGLKPEDKVATIKELTDQGRKVAMVGDGVNDAPSLAAAYVSVAMGARGSDAALEQSDVVLMQDKIEKLLTARELSLKARAHHQAEPLHLPRRHHHHGRVGALRPRAAHARRHRARRQHGGRVPEQPAAALRAGVVMRTLLSDITGANHSLRPGMSVFRNPATLLAVLNLAGIAAISQLSAAPAPGEVTRGGAGGRELLVTRLDDDPKHPAKGSLRWALKQKGPRIVKFAVSGDIILQDKLLVREPFLTIDGSDAPGGGVCIRGGSLMLQGHARHPGAPGPHPARRGAGAAAAPRAKRAPAEAFRRA